MPDANNAKIHPALRAHLEGAAVEGAVAGVAVGVPIIVKYKAGMAGARAVVAGVQMVRRHYRLFDGRALSATRAGIHALAAQEDVEMVWLDEEIHTMLDVSVPLIRVPQVWAAGFTGQGVKVAIVDTGIDPDHPDFAGRVAAMSDFSGEGPRDNNGHGTHVAGIVGGSGAQSGGKYRGVAPECSFYTAKVLKGSGSGQMSDVIAGIEWAVDQKAQVINLSLGGGSANDGTDALSVACDATVDLGLVVCVANGNEGPAPSTAGSPACARKVISIGATDDNDHVADFSSRGPTSDGRVKPDVCFPGVGIISARAKGTAMGGPLDDFYTSASGTSMATPHATGTSALLLQANPNLTPAQIKDIFMKAAKDLGLDPNTQGKGRVDAFAAYQQATQVEPTPTPPPTPTPTPPPPQPPPQGGGCFELIARFLGGR